MRELGYAMLFSWPIALAPTRARGIVPITGRGGPDTMTNYLFRNKETGEIRRGVSFSLNSAARLAGIDVPMRGALPEPWMPWEYWDKPDRCVWHYTESGDCLKGGRQ